MNTFDRDYFKKKENPNLKKGIEVTKCCGLETHHTHLNKNNLEDWRLIEDHCAQHLRDYPSTETITALCCKTCGRLIKYTSTLNSKAYK